MPVLFANLRRQVFSRRGPYCIGLISDTQMGVDNESSSALDMFEDIDTGEATEQIMDVEVQMKGHECLCFIEFIKRVES